MQPTTCFHDGIANTVSQEAYLVFAHTVTFHPAHGVFDTNAERRDRTIGRFLRWGKFPLTRFLLRLDEGDAVAQKALEAHILVEATAVWQCRALQLRQAFLMRLAFIGRAQEAELTRLLEHEEVFDRVARLLAAVVVLVVLGIGGAIDRSLSPIMPNRGAPGTSAVRFAASMTASSSAFRAGRSSCGAHA
jgi:hypothetical protein